MIKYKVFLISVLFGMGTATILWNDTCAQNNDSRRYSFEFSGTGLYEALQEIANTSETDLVFDPDILGDETIYKRIRDKPVESVLSEVLEGTGLDYIVLSSGTVVIIRASRRSPGYGTFAGKVYDAETGEALPGATVMLADASGGTSSNPGGYFSLGKLKSGSYEIIFSYVGYKPEKKTVTVVPGREQHIQVGLETAQVDVVPIVVSAHHPLMPLKDGGEISGEDRTEWGSGVASAGSLRNLNLFSGVQYGLPLTDLHLQGGQSGDHRLFLDGVPVYNPYSFGQLYSSFSPYALGRITVEKAGYDVASGSYIAGKVNLRHDVSDRRGERAVIQADPLNTNVRFTHGDTESKLQVLGAFRHSVWNWYQAPSMSDVLRDWDDVDPLTYQILVNAGKDAPLFESKAHRTDVNYHDAHLAGSLEFDEYRNFSFSLYQGRNTLQKDVLAAAMTDPAENRMFGRDAYTWNNLISQLRYNWLVTPRLDLQIQTSYSGNTMDHRYAMFDSEQITGITGIRTEPEDIEVLAARIGDAAAQTDRNEIRHYTLQGDASYTFNPQLTLSGGLKYDYLYSVFNLSGLFYLPSLNEQQTPMYASYIKARWNPETCVRVTAGMRVTLPGLNGRVYSEPRMSIQYDRSTASAGYWSVKLSGGIYRQFINKFDITNVGPSSLVSDFPVWSHDSTMEQPVSYNTGLQIRWEPAERSFVTLDGYVRIQPKAYITSYRNLLLGSEEDRTGLESFAEMTNMRAYGGGIRIYQATPGDRVQFLGGYDLSISRVNYETIFGRMLPAPWNEPHRLQARVLGRMSSWLSLIAAWQSVIGRRWGFRQAYYDFLVLHNFTSAGSHDFLSPEKDRMDPFHQLDVTLVFRQELGNIRAQLRLDLVNVLNRRNTVDWMLVPLTGTHAGEEQQFRIKKRRMAAFYPSISLQLGF